MKKHRTPLTLILTMFLVLTTVFSVPVSAAGKVVPGKVALNKVSTSAYNKVTVNWKKASNVTNYIVYYRLDGKKSWSKLATVSSSKTSYTHKASSKHPITVGKKYRYTVRGYNSKSKTYGSYNTKGYTVQTKPDTVKMTKAAVNKDGSVTIQWKAAGGADRYVLYRKAPGESWKKYKTFSNTKKPGSTLSYKDKKPLKGVKNSYTVRSYNSKSKVYGSYSSKGITTKAKAPGKPEPKPTEPPKPTEKPTEPAPTEPKPEPTEPAVKPTEPKPEPTEPAVKPTEPKPEPTEPVVKPTEPKPEPTEPVVKPTEPEPTEPAVKPTEPKPEPTEPVVKPTEPEPTEPAPKPTEPKPTEPAPIEPKPTEPAPTEPKPTEPAPIEPKPTDPEPTEPKPTEPEPTEPAPKPTEPTPSEPVNPEPDPNEQAYIMEVANLVNQERAKEGLPPLVLDPALTHLAAIRADEQETLYSHTRPNGTPWHTVFKENGAYFGTAAENIAAGQRSPAEVMNSWMNSPGHRANILAEESGRIGIGYHKAPDGTPYWVQLFTN